MTHYRGRSTSIQTAAGNKHDREQAAWMCGSLAAACFACFLTAANGRLQGRAVEASMLFFWFAIPPLLGMMMSTKQYDPERLSPGPFMSWLATFAAISAALGIITFVWSFDAIAGGVAAVTTAIVLVSLSRSENNYKTQAKAPIQTTNKPQNEAKDSLKSPTKTENLAICND